MKDTVMGKLARPHRDPKYIFNGDKGAKLNNKETIEIPRSWLEGLFERKNIINNTLIETIPCRDFSPLMAYIDSAEHILNLNTKQDERTKDN